MNHKIYTRVSAGFAALLLALSSVVIPAGPAFAAESSKPVYCNMQGASGKWKAQISNGNTSHEQLLYIDGVQVFAHSQSEVQASWDDVCAQLYGSDAVVEVTPPACGVYTVAVTISGRAGDYSVLVDGAPKATKTLTSTTATTIDLDLTANGAGTYTIAVKDAAGTTISTKSVVVGATCPTHVTIPEAPAVTDPCGEGNASWNQPADTATVTWAINANRELVASTTAGHMFSDNTTSHNYGTPVETNTAACVTPTIKACSTITGPELVTTKSQFADYAYQDTRADGHTEFTSNGLHIWTTLGDSTSKVAWYKTVDYALATVGTPSMEYTANSGIAPGLQLIVDFDNNGTPDGILVGESIYGNNWWLSNSAQQFVKDAAPHNGGGNGSQWFGTLDEWLTAFPSAQVKSVGFSLGSGVIADGVLTSLTFGCHKWTFGVAETPATPCTVRNNTYIQPWTFDGDAYPISESYPEGGVAGTYTFTADGLLVTTQNEESTTYGLIDAGATPLRDIDAMSYKTFRKPTSTGATNILPGYVLYVDLDGSNNTVNDRTFYLYEPVYNGTVQTGVWQTWDVLAGGTSTWWGNGSGDPDRTWNDILAAYPNATALAYGFNQGTSNLGTEALIQDIGFDCATTHFAAPGKGGGDTPVVPETPVTPVASTPATPETLPQLLPHTGPSDTSTPQGLLLALIAAIATYGAVYFAQGKRRYEQ